MILADKIMLHRKNLGWSQEEFAYKMNVSRQAVSKWEQAQSTPDLDKILLMASLFSVSTDYLLKDDQVEPEFLSYQESVVKRVTLEEANEYLDVTESVRKLIAFGVALCIMSPIPVLLTSSKNSNEFYGALGPTGLILMVALAVFIFIVNGIKLNQFEYLDKEVFELEYGVESMATQKMNLYRQSFVTLLAGGVILCILSVIPLFFIEHFANTLYEKLSVIGFLFVVAMGVYLIVSSTFKWSAYKKLLQVGDYKKENKRVNDILEPIAGVYWMLTTAIYLLISFTQNNWHQTWVIWPVAGVLFGAISIIVTSIAKFSDR